MVKNRKQLKAKRISAFEEIVSKYEAGLLRYAVRIVNNHDTAQDIVQEAFIKLLKHWKGDFEPSPELSSWLYRVTHNCAVDFLRKETRHHALHRRQSSEKPDFAPPDRGEGFNANPCAEKASRALGVLNMRERQLVILKVYEEKSYREMSKITGLSVSNIGYILHHAMRKMAEELKKNSAI